MKKRAFSLLLVVAMLLSIPFSPFYASAATTDNITAPTDLCGCGCGKKFEDITWTPWTANPGSGHYYLSGDYSMDEFNVISGEKTVLDLRGYTITTKSSGRLFIVNGYLGILDTVGGGRATAYGKYHEVGGVVWVYDYETTGSTFELYSGTLCLTASHTTPGSGGLVYASTGGSFLMRGGVLMEGTTYKYGGCLGISGADVSAQILGGKIIGGKATDAGGNIAVLSGATLTMKNATVLGGVSADKGGNVYVSSSTANIDSCSIGNGVSNFTTTGTGYGGGNICTFNLATLNLSNSEIYGGYALLHGGNLCLGKSTHNLEGNNIWGGTCEGKGANVYCSLPGATSTFEDDTIAGDMYFGNSPLTLKGAVKIGMNATGLVLKQTSKTVKVSGLTAGAEIYVSGNTSKISGSSTYLKPALDAQLSVSGTTVTVAPAADGETAGYCPHCNSQTAWQSYGTENASHVYLTADMADFTEVSVSSDLCIDLRGFDITASGRAFTVADGGKLAIIDSVGGGIVTGAGIEGENGGVISNNGILKIMGGKYVYTAGNTVTSGGVICTTSDTTVSGAILDASAFDNKTDDVAGGAFYGAEESGNITLSGCRVLGGSAYRGGSIYIYYNNTATITGCQISDGKSVTGGANLGVNGDKVSGHTNGFLTLTKTQIRDGKASTEYGGNLHIGRWGATIADCYIRDGETKEYGGNISFGVCPDSGVTFTDTLITGGSSKNKGGNIYAAGASKKVEFTNCLITNGSAAIGGNINLNLGAFTFFGGEISHGTASGSGGNIYAGTSTGTGLTLTDGVLVCNGHSGTYGGNLYVSDKVNLADVSFHDGHSDTDQGDDIYLTGATSTTLTFGADLTGDIYLCASTSILSKGETGTVIGNMAMAEGATLGANVYLGGSYGNVAILQVGDTFYTASALVVDNAGQQHWFESNATAVQAAQAGNTLKLYTNDDLVLDKDLYVDLNGHTVTVYGSGTVYGLDSAGDDFNVSAGKLKVDGQIIIPEQTDTTNGNHYIALANGNEYSFHRFELKITGVNIRPSEAGIYYTAKWSCDDVLKEQITAYGVVASTVDMPGSNFTEETENCYTAFTKESFVSGETKNGAIISKIMEMSSKNTENNSNGKTKVYAKAYITFNGSQTLISDDNIGFSLYDLMTSLDWLIMNRPIQYRKFTNTARNFYETWKDKGMDSWQLTKIPDPGEDNIINVLMIGNSGCYYYVEEMHEMAKAAGIDLRVCNVYYSGCPLDKHYTWWVNGKSNYQFYETYTDGRKCTNNVSLEWCLAQYEWDFISLQESSDLAKNGAAVHFEKARLYWETLLDYLIEQFPDAQILWKENAGRQIPYSKDGVEYTPETQAQQTLIHQTFSKMLREHYNEPGGDTLLKTVPVAGTWANVRENGYDYLCARLNTTHSTSGIPHAGDGSHDGDIGGGQYLNACVWFETVTGLSCLDVDYIPEYKTSAVIGDELLSKLHVVKTDIGYTLDPDFAAMLKQAAHDAVLALENGQ